MPPLQGPAARSASFHRGRTAEQGTTSRLWYRAVGSPASIGAKQLALISDYFADALVIAGWPEGACLFMSGRFPGGTPADGDRVTAAIFFSPAAIEVVPHLLAACGAEPSPPPDRADATLLVGKSSDWTLLSYAHH